MEWVRQVAPTRVRPTTLNRYEQVIERYLVPGIGKKKLAGLSARDVRAFLAQLANQNVGGYTVLYTHAVLRAALEDATREEIISRNVAKLVRAPRPRKPERQPWTVEQVKTLLRSVRDYRLSALFVVLALLGLRRSESLGTPLGRR